MQASKTTKITVDEIQETQSVPQAYLWLIRGLFILGLFSLYHYLSWWFVDDRLRSPLLIIIFLAALLYAVVQLLLNWILYLVASYPPQALQLPQKFSIDVYVTSFNEPLAMIAYTLDAAVKMHCEHNTWLLDDGDNSQFAELAESLGAGYLTRTDKANAKAGNLNAALDRTDGEIVVIFDADHVPAPDFLEKSLGYFTDPEIGFVQVMLTFDNPEDSWVAQAVVETSLEYYNPTSLGAYTLGGATMMGSNALIRRAALESIGGYQPGLAEDLATSVALHAAGWKSTYVAEPLAPGMAPPNFLAWFVQQLKWARGVFELLIKQYPRLFVHLTWGQRLSYAVRMTKYWIGPAVAFHLFATILILTIGDFQQRAAFHEYLYKLTPLVFCDAVIRYISLRVWRHKNIKYSPLIRAILLVYSTWPIYLLAWFMSVLRFPLSFRPTPKNKSGVLNPVWLLPQIATIILVLAGMLYTVLVLRHPPSLLLIYAIVQGALQMVILYRWMISDILHHE